MPAFVEVGGLGLWALLRVTRPLGYTLYDRVTPLLGEGDQEVFASEGMREMFIGDLQNGSRKQFQAALHDATLFGRDWGFRLADVSVPVRWWHGDIDPIVPLSAAEAAYPRPARRRVPPAPGRVAPRRVRGRPRGPRGRWPSCDRDPARAGPPERQRPVGP